MGVTCVVAGGATETCDGAACTTTVFGAAGLPEAVGTATKAVEGAADTLARTLGTAVAAAVAAVLAAGGAGSCSLG